MMAHPWCSVVSVLWSVMEEGLNTLFYACEKWSSSLHMIMLPSPLHFWCLENWCSGNDCKHNCVVQESCLSSLFRSSSKPETQVQVKVQISVLETSSLNIKCWGAVGTGGCLKQTLSVEGFFQVDWHLPFQYVVGFLWFLSDLLAFVD